MMNKMLSNGSTIVDIAWAGGLFKGEGCITKAKNTLVLRLAMTDKDTVEKFARVLGMGNIGNPYKKNINHKSIYCWNVGGFEKVQTIIGLFWNFLGERRKLRAIEVLRNYKEKPNYNKAKKICPQGHLYIVENTYIDKKKNSRYCKLCRKETNSLYRKRKKINGS